MRFGFAFGLLYWLANPASAQKMQPAPSSPPSAVQPSSAMPSRAAPEVATGLSRQKLVTAKRQMVVSANKHASKAGLQILRAGGSAIDAGIAVAMVLNLVEPQSSGLGGGGFMLYWDAKTRRLYSYDGREAAPAAAKPDRFLLGGKRRKFFDAVFGGLSVGVPGLLRALEMAHKDHGRLRWARLFRPAIKLAEDGFAVSPRLHKMLARQGPKRFFPKARRYFFDANGKAWPEGQQLANPEFAKTLRAIAKGGADVFYKGPIAQRILTAVQKAPTHKSDMTAADLAGYQAKRRPPVCAPYRRYKVCGMGLPSSGGLTVAQVLKLLAPFDLGKAPAAAMNVKALHLMAEAQKLAFADRKRFMADPDFVAVPVAGLLDDAYLAQRRLLISKDATMGKAKPGNPPQIGDGQFGRDQTIENKGTTHFSIVDADGNALSMTSSIETAFGSRLMAGGFLLNNELTDFSFFPRAKDGRLIANRVEGGKRPRSSMSPTIIFDDQGKVKALLGSSGGSRIINYVLKSLVAMLDWRLDAQAAVVLPNFGSRRGPIEMEQDPLSARRALGLLLLGHNIRATSLTSGTHVILRRDGLLQGGADPRREGLALGD